MREGPYRGKRAFDILLAALLTLPSAAISLFCAAAIKLEDRGPVLFTQERVGLHGRPFRIFKFRTMRPGDPNPLFPDPAQITRVGKVLRRLSLDELPQLINVWRGEMSMVGPRPTLAYQVARYSNDQRKRLAVRPGLTGLAQIRGRNNLPWSARIELDLEYIERQSVSADLWLLLKSFSVVFSIDVGGHPTDDPIARLDASPD